jgi:hypothetical protein
MYPRYVMLSWLTRRRQHPGAAAMAQAALDGDDTARQIFFRDILAEEEWHINSIQPGDKVFVKTCTHFYIGCIEKNDATVLVLAKGNCWVPQVGRLYKALESGKCDEIEVLPCRTHIAVGSVVAIYDWDHPVPTEHTTPDRADN